MRNDEDDRDRRVVRGETYFDTYPIDDITVDGPDRAVDFLTAENGLAETVRRSDDVAVVLRVVRDDLAGAQRTGEIQRIEDVVPWLNARIRALGPITPTETGDTLPRTDQAGGA